MMVFLKIENVFFKWMCFLCECLIEYELMCKIMLCKKCKEEFCFVCFGVVVRGNLLCGKYNEKC